LKNKNLKTPAEKLAGVFFGVIVSSDIEIVKLKIKVDPDRLK
jgi:hypothetical protein